MGRPSWQGELFQPAGQTFLGVSLYFWCLQKVTSAQDALPEQARGVEGPFSTLFSPRVEKPPLPKH